MQATIIQTRRLERIDGYGWVIVDTGSKTALCAQSLATPELVGAFSSIAGRRGSARAKHAEVFTQLPWITEEEGHTIDAVLATLRMKCGYGGRKPCVAETVVESPV